MASLMLLSCHDFGRSYQVRRTVYKCPTKDLVYFMFTILEVIMGKQKCKVRMPTTKKRPKSGFAFGISNTSLRLLFPDQNSLNLS